MTTNLLDMARAQLTPEVIQRASSLVGESPASTQRAMETAAPTIFAGLVEEGSSVAGANHLLVVLQEAGLSGTMAGITERKEAESGPLDSLIDTGKRLLGRLFGGRVGSIVEAVASSSGVKRSSMSSLLGLTTPLVLGALGSEIATRHLDAPGLVRFLAEQKRSVIGLLPTGVAAALGSSSVPVREVHERPAALASSPSSRFPWILLAIIPLALILGFLLRSREAVRTSVPEASRRVEAEAEVEQAPPVVRAPQEANPPATANPPAMANPPAAAKAPLVGEGTASEQLAVFLAAPGGELPRRFVLDNLNFDFATAQLVPGSTGTVDSVAAVLKDHPTTEIVLEGHTDNVGDAATNQRLSQQRADAIKAALAARGVAAERISTAGIGQDRPLTSNDTDEGRAQNRRVEIVVVRQ
jgi:OmpA-OmpF porin, OOP family